MNATHGKCSVLAEFIVIDNLGIYNKFIKFREFREFMLQNASIVYLRGWN